MKDAIRHTIKRIMVNKTIRNGALFSIYSFINKGISFLLLLVMANLMTPAEYGYLNLFNTVIMLLAVVVALSSEGYLSVAYFQEGLVGTRKSFSVVLTISTIIMTAFCGFVFISPDALVSKLELSKAILYFAILISFFTVFSNLFLDYNRIKEKIGIYGLFSIGCALLNLIVSLLFVGQLHMGWEGRVYAQLLCMIFFGGIGLFYFLNNHFFTKDSSTSFKPILIWALPLIPHAATNFIRQGCDRYIINYFHTIDDVGLFSMALTLVNIITMIGFGFNQSLSVDIYKTLSDDSILHSQKKRKLARQRSVLMGLYAMTTVAAVAITYFLIPIILPQYTKALSYFIVLSFYGFGICIYLLYTNYLFFYKRTRQIMYITFGASVIHLLLSMIVTRYDLLYTAIIYGLTQLLIVLLIRHYALSTVNANLN